MRLLGNQKGELKIVESKSVVVEFVDVDEEAHVLDGLFREFFAVLFAEVS